MGALEILWNAARVRALRAALARETRRGWSLTRLAREIDVDRAALWRWESGRTRPNTESMIKLTALARRHNLLREIQRVVGDQQDDPSTDS